MENVREVILEISKDYIEENGVVRFFNRNEDHGPYETQNPYLWTGQFYMAVRYLTYDFLDRKGLYNFHEKNLILPGLFTRFPGEYIDSIHYDSISLDEHNGLCFVAASSIGVYWIMEVNDVYNYGNEYGWVFDEKNPKVSIMSYLLKNPLSIFSIPKSLVELYKVAKATNDWNGSGEMDQVIFKNPLLKILSRKRLPKDIFIIKILAKPEKITLFEKLHFYLSCYHTITSPKKSGVNMLLFKFVYFKVIGYENFIIKYLRNKFINGSMDIMKFQREFYGKNELFIYISSQLLRKLREDK